MGADRANLHYHIEEQIEGDDKKRVGDIRTIEIELTAAEIIAMYTTPKTLIAAPGAGKVIEFISAVGFLDHGGTDFADGGAVVIQTITGNTALSDSVAAATLINVSADAYVIFQALSAEVATNLNDGLELTNATQVFSTGNGVLRLKVTYRIHDFN
ncbi:MAG: hypothetical protein ACW99U_16980 [Candidatus Thorarchaeota archaeon]|jgi:hypothetical protein